MRVSTRIPPIYFKCKKAFGVEWDRGLAITYGDTVYAKYPLAPSVQVHEAVHIEQQALIGAEAWWDRYLIDKKFRLEQEVPAYKAQAEYIKTHQRSWMVDIRRLAVQMEEMYGDMIDYKQALNLLL